MLWLIGQISIFLLIAAMVGFLIGWLLRAIWPSSRSRAREGEMEAALERAGSRIADLEAGLRAKRNAANAAAEQEEAALRRVEQCEAALADLRARGGADAGEVERLRTELNAASRSMDRLHRELAEIKAETMQSSSSAADAPREDPSPRPEPSPPTQGGLFLVQDDEPPTPDLAAESNPDPEPAPLATVDDEEALETIRLAAVAEVTDRFEASADVMPDDLKRIHGVGPALERLLRAMNITTFRQIADFTDDDVELVSAALGRAFPGRITRDDWIGGARALLAEDYPGE